MDNRMLLRLTGACAVAGGALRIADTFAAGAMDQRTLQLLYFATDVFLLFGLLGFYRLQAKELGSLGTLGFVVALIGLLMVRSSALFDYASGAAVWLFGLAALSIAMLMRTTRRVAPILWLLSLASAIMGALVPSAAWTIAVAGITFGAGFIVAGMYLLKAPRES
jgi:hypothetical protein